MTLTGDGMKDALWVNDLTHDGGSDIQEVAQPPGNRVAATLQLALSVAPPLPGSPCAACRYADAQTLRSTEA